MTRALQILGDALATIDWLGLGYKVMIPANLVMLAALWLGSGR